VPLGPPHLAWASWANGEHQQVQSRAILGQPELARTQLHRDRIVAELAKISEASLGYHLNTNAIQPCRTIKAAIVETRATRLTDLKHFAFNGNVRSQLVEACRTLSVSYP
jgi:hypothetical protein